MIRLAVGLATFALSACSGGSDRAAPVASPPEIDAAVGFSLARYERSMLQISDCAVDARGSDRACAGWAAVDTERSDNTALIGEWTEQLADLGARHIADPQPAVRLHAARLLINAGANEPGRIARVVEAAVAERDPRVLAAMIAMAGPDARRDDVRALLIGHASHASPRVRIEVVTWLTARTAVGTEDTLEAALDMIATDADDDVRARGCRSLGDRGEPRVLPTLERLTTSPETPSALYQACFAALIAMWCGPIPPQAPNQRAYDLTLELLRATPRSPLRPAWKALTALKWAADDTLAERAPWIEQRALHAALAEIVADPRADWMARTTAIDQLESLSAARALFARLRKRLGAEALRHPGRLVAERLDKALID